MCLSHYRQSNEYSHVLAQQFKAVVECKKKTKSVKGRCKDFFFSCSTGVTKHTMTLSSFFIIIQVSQVLVY